MTKLTEAQFQEALTAVANSENKAEAAASISLSVSALNRRLSNGRRLYGDNTDPMIEVPEGFVVKGTSSLVKPDGTIAAQWIKTTRDHLDTEAMAQAIEKRFSKWSKKAPSISKPKEVEQGILATYIVADAHLGLYAWGDETGDDWDLKTALKDLRSCFTRLVEATPNAETAIILELGDFLHADNNESTTPKSGHSLDTDGRHQKVLEAAVEVTIWAIHEALKKHERVIYVSKRGNHDPTSGMILPIALKHFFANEPRVQIETSPSKHWFMQFGSTLLGGTHGDTLKQDKMPGFMAAEVPEMWGATKYRYFWSGHLHHRRAQEYPGVTCEIARTITGRDTYHASHGYKSLREMTAVVYSDVYGEIERYTARPDVRR